ncbi:MAG: flagellar protein FlaG [Candidatus Kapabacteria bacterium]|nr:flagellar protein FlaG [Candidatus Kapabacteria bacterium]
MINAIGSSEGISLSNFDSLMSQVYVSDKKIDLNNRQKNDVAKEENVSSENKKINTNKVNYSELSRNIKTILDDNRLAIEFTRDTDTKEMIMKIINDETKEVIRQYPAEISLKIARLVAANIDTGKITNAVV